MSELKLNRLAVLLQLIFIPTYFIIFTIINHAAIILYVTQFINYSFSIFKFEFTFNFFHLSDRLIEYFVIFGIPIVFSFPGLVISIIRANKIANTYELMGRAIGKVRIDQKLLYGLNALFVLVIIILPFFSPILVIFALFYSIRLLLRKLLIGKLNFLVWLIPSLIIAYIPMIVAGGMYFSYVTYFSSIYVQWVQSIDAMFGVGLSLAIAIAIGNFILINQEGAVQYSNRKEVNYEMILFLKIVLFVIFILLYFGDPEHGIIGIINIVGLVLGVAVLLIKFIKKVEGSADSGVGFLMIPIFSLVNFISSQFTKSVLVLLTAGVFYALFVISYRYADDEELFDE